MYMWLCDKLRGNNQEVSYNGQVYGTCYFVIGLHNSHSMAALTGSPIASPIAYGITPLVWPMFSSLAMVFLFQQWHRASYPCSSSNQIIALSNLVPQGLFTLHMGIHEIKCSISRGPTPWTNHNLKTISSTTQGRHTHNVPNSCTYYGTNTLTIK